MSPFRIVFVFQMFSIKPFSSLWRSFVFNRIMWEIFNEYFQAFLCYLASGFIFPCRNNYSVFILRFKFWLLVSCWLKIGRFSVVNSCTDTVIVCQVSINSFGVCHSSLVFSHFFVISHLKVWLFQLSVTGLADCQVSTKVWLPVKCKLKELGCLSSAS